MVETIPPSDSSTLTVQLPDREPFVFGIRELKALPEKHQIEDIAELDSRRSGRAVRFEAVLEQLGIGHEFQFARLHSSDGDYQTVGALAPLAESGWILYEHEGRPLPSGWGGPFRFLIPDAPHCSPDSKTDPHAIDACINVKFLTRIDLLTTPDG